MMKIKLFDPFIGKEEQVAVNKVLKSHFWASGQGIGKVMEFENRFKKYIDCNSCVAVNNGTSALHLALSLFDIKKKDVIVPSMTFVSTVHSIINNGGRPVFVDIDPNTLCLDPDGIKKHITKETKVILPVHFGGMPAEIDQIKEICNNHECVLIEDAAHACGSRYNSMKIGTHGTAVCFSFHPVKNLAMPTGGLITLNGRKHANYKRILQTRRWCGISHRIGATYDVDDLGWNMYMNEFSAAIGIVQLKRLDHLNKRRRDIARRYSEEIYVDYKMPYNQNCAYHLYWIRVKNRLKFMKGMKDSGIETGIHYRPVHQMSFYREKTKLPVTEKIGNEIVTIPIHPNLNNSDVDLIIKSINRLY